MPNSAAPASNLASMSLRVGKWNLSPASGLALRGTSQNATSVTIKAPPITKARLGSQKPFSAVLETPRASAPTSRNASTLAGCVMPPKTSPTAKTAPDRSAQKAR